MVFQAFFLSLRCDTTEFKLSKSQKKVLKKMRKFLVYGTGEIVPLNNCLHLLLILHMLDEVNGCGLNSSEQATAIVISHHLVSKIKFKYFVSYKLN